MANGDQLGNDGGDRIPPAVENAAARIDSTEFLKELAALDQPSSAFRDADRVSEFMKTGSMAVENTALQTAAKVVNEINGPSYSLAKIGETGIFRSVSQTS